MSDFLFVRKYVEAGTYCGTLTSTGRIKGEPVLELRLLDRSLGPLTVTADTSEKRTWHIKGEIPASVISDGVQTILVHDLRSGETLDSFALVAGTPLDGDLRAEIALLRAELNLLKSAFRQHCANKKT